MNSGKTRGDLGTNSTKINSHLLLCTRSLLCTLRCSVHLRLCTHPALAPCTAAPRIHCPGTAPLGQRQRGRKGATTCSLGRRQGPVSLLCAWFGVFVFLGALEGSAGVWKMQLAGWGALQALTGGQTCKCGTPQRIAYRARTHRSASRTCAKCGKGLQRGRRENADRG